MESEQSSTPNVSSAATKPYRNVRNVTQSQGFWIPTNCASAITSFQNHFQALNDDIIVANKPKAGTTWLKALVFSIVNLHRYTLSNTPLNSANCHELIHNLERHLYKEKSNPDLSKIRSLRLFATHLPFSMLADLVKASSSRIFYTARNPFDVIVSYWHFLRGMRDLSDWPLENCFEMFCRDEEWLGPFWDYVLRY